MEPENNKGENFRVYFVLGVIVHDMCDNQVEVPVASEVSGVTHEVCGCKWDACTVDLLSQ